MVRRKLIVRRFGALSFGLGYYDDGVWIDHLLAPGQTDAADVAPIHALLDCCGARAGDHRATIAVGTPATNGATREPIVAAGRAVPS